MTYARKSASATYAEWTYLREPYLRRARDCARLTVPTLVPPKGYTPETTLPTPYQALGAQGLNNLASKLLLSLFPPTQPFFRLVPADPESLRAGGEQVETEVEEGLTRMERIMAAAFETANLRPKLVELLKHLLVSGNGVLDMADEEATRVVPLEQYVARLSPHGFLETLIIRESMDVDTLPPELRALRPQPSVGAAPEAPIDERRVRRCPTVDLFTCIDWDPDAKVYRVHQELESALVPDSVGSYKRELLPYRVLRFIAVDGEDYGRGHVEAMLGDLASLESLVKSIVEAAAITARLVGLVDPAGAATADDLNNAPNGAYVVGRATDVTYPQVGKSGDLQVALATVDRLERRVAQGFLMNSSVQRQAERVTAEEIRYLAQELEATLGGVFSVLSQELQLPLVEIIRHRLVRARRLPKLPDRSVRAAIVTGVEALGRNQELARLNLAVQSAQAVVGPEQVAQYTNARELLGRIFTAAGVDTAGLLRSQEEVQAEAQQAQAMAMAQRLGPDVIKQLGPGIAQRMGLGADQAETPPPAAPAS